MLVEEGAQIMRCRSDRKGWVDLGDMLKMLARQGVMHLLVEGGAETYSNFFSLGLVDRVSLYMAMKLLGGKATPLLTDLRLSSLKKAIELGDPTIEKIGKDLWLETDL
jgi:diaminohydroxyphosphoribosylaminopyrimidine deaminase/5-amino-6-(5-phosphoribosylamino)uracil reductase